MKLEDVKKLLESANLDEKQVKALDKFFEEYTEQVRDDERNKLKVSDNPNEEMISKADAEGAFKMFQEDAEKAFKFFEKDSEKAFGLFRTDSEKAFELYKEDMQNEYTENMVKGLKELYTDIEERVSKDFLESKDVVILENIKKVIAPLMAVENEQILLEEINDLKAEKNELMKESKTLNRDNIISSLVKDFPENYTETIKEFISTGETDDDIYERFSVICELIDQGALDEKKLKKELITEEVSKKDTKKKKAVKKIKPKPKKMITEELNNLGEQSIKSKSKKPKIAKEKSPSYFTEEETAILEMINF